MGVTFGQPGQPNQLTVNLDSIFSTSLANYRKTLADNVSTGNPFFYEVKKSGMWEEADGGSMIQEDLLYDLTPADSYDGFDTLPTTPPEGITAAFFDWRQASGPIAYSEKERKMNKKRIINFVESRIQQTEVGLIQYFNQAVLQGSGDGALTTPKTSPVNGSSSIDPLPKMINFDPTTATNGTIGGIDQSQAANAWWRNRTKTSSATTYSAFLLEADNLWNTCFIGPGGGPNLILVDQVTWELWRAAYYFKYRTEAHEDEDYPFPNFKFNRARVVWDPYVPDVYSNLTSTATYGTAFFINTKFVKIRYESETDFTQTEFIKPANQDTKVAHVLWMGQMTSNNRRKLGVFGKIPRTLTAA